MIEMGNEGEERRKKSSFVLEREGKKEKGECSGDEKEGGELTLVKAKEKEILHGNIEKEKLK